MKKLIATLFLITATVGTTQNALAFEQPKTNEMATIKRKPLRPGQDGHGILRPNTKPMYGQNGAGQRQLGGPGGRQLAPSNDGRVSSVNMGRYNLQQGKTEGYAGIPTTTAIGGNGNNQVGYGYEGESANKAQIRYKR